VQFFLLVTFGKTKCRDVYTPPFFTKCENDPIYLASRTIVGLGLDIVFFPKFSSGDNARGPLRWMK
jgi:hypothetical protein